MSTLPKKTNGTNGEEPVSNSTTDSTTQAHLDGGNGFEPIIFERHKSVMELQEAQVGTYLYQLKLELPPDFYTHVIGNKTAYRMNEFIPDFLYI